MLFASFGMPLVPYLLIYLLHFCYGTWAIALLTAFSRIMSMVQVPPTVANTVLGLSSQFHREVETFSAAFRHSGNG